MLMFFKKHTRPSEGFIEAQGKGLRDLVFQFKDFWKVKLSADGPAKLTPLKSHSTPDAVPRASKDRRSAPQHVQYTRKPIKLLEDIDNILIIFKETREVAGDLPSRLYQN